MAQRVLESLGRLEEEHSDWLEALAAQETLDRYGAGEEPEEEDGWEEERETVRLYLAREAEEYGPTEYVSPDRDPVWLWLESVLSFTNVWHSEGRDSEPELVGWELLLCYGGPSAGLELTTDGRATVWAAHWSPTEYAHGRLEWLANYLEELGL
jgi:hypothetical protein